MGAAAATLKVAFSGLDDVMQTMFDPSKAEDFEKALAQLAPSAQSAMRAVQGLGKEFSEVVKTPVQQAFFAGLGPEISKLSGFLRPLKSSLLDVAQGFNDGANKALNFINTARGTRMVNTLLEDSGRIASEVGNAVVRLIPGFASVAAAATSVVRELIPVHGTLGDIAGGWSRTMLRMQETGELQAKFRGLLDTASQFGQVLGQVGSVIGGVFRAAAAAGAGNPFAQWMATLSKVSEWVNSFAGQNALTTFFTSAREAVGAVIPVFLQIAQVIGSTVAPIIANLATTLGPALVPAIQAIGEGIANAAPQIEALGGALGWFSPWSAADSAAGAA